ncbi:MAG TPA: amino acid aminotransferase [Cellvibrionaceae bacterium]
MFEHLPLLPADPILGLSSAFAADPSPRKVDLGVGVYRNAHGLTPILESVKRAQTLRAEQETTKAYTAPAGIPGANTAVQELTFGKQHRVINHTRIATLQTPGGCGALRVAAELIQRTRPGATVWVSTPTWGNHIPLLGNAGLKLKEYPYYDFERHTIDFDRMMSTLNQAQAGDLVLLHASCHNPSGADLTREQWQAVADCAATIGFTPFIDMAYQGFGEGVDEDAWGLRLLAENLPELILATSFSKNFGLYRERAGSLSVVGSSSHAAAAINSQLLNITRGLYSMPPAHGAAIVDIIYHSPELYSLWQSELANMRERIQQLREQLVGALNTCQAQRDFSFIRSERGMFSFLGLSTAEVRRLKQEFSIYMTENSRINVAGLNDEKLGLLSEAIGSL